MSLAKEINQKLDEIILHNQELEMVEQDYADPDFELKDVNTGKIVTKEMVLNEAQDKYNKILKDLNNLTNSGQNCRDIFTNPYYINDFAQDKVIAQEISNNKLNTELTKQIESNN